MNIIEFYESANREKWLSQIRLCDWKAGPFLCELIDKDKFHSTLGESSKLFLLTDKKRTRYTIPDFRRGSALSIHFPRTEESAV